MKNKGLCFYPIKVDTLKDQPCKSGKPLILCFFLNYFSSSFFPGDSPLTTTECIHKKIQFYCQQNRGFSLLTRLFRFVINAKL